MHKPTKPRVRGAEDLRPESDERRAEKVTRGALDVPIALWPTGLDDAPIPFRPLDAAVRT